MSATTTTTSEPTMNVADLLHSFEAHGETYVESFVRTRTGKRIHAQSAGSSVTRCGHWQRAASHYFAVDPSRVEVAHLCGSCFPLVQEKRGELEAAQEAAADAERQEAVRQAVLGRWDAYEAVEKYRGIARKAGAPVEVQRRLTELSRELADLDPESWGAR